MKAQEAIDNYVNGNISDFKKWLKGCSKVNMLHAIEYYQGHYGKRHQIINYMMIYLED